MHSAMKTLNSRIVKINTARILRNQQKFVNLVMFKNAKNAWKIIVVVKLVKMTPFSIQLKHKKLCAAMSNIKQPTVNHTI